MKSKRVAMSIALGWSLFVAAPSAFGQNWMDATNFPPPAGTRLASYMFCACSADGTRLVVAGISQEALQGTSLYTSADSGATWTWATNLPWALTWSAVASSADGSKLVAAVGQPLTPGGGPGPIYTSIDAGVTWVQATNAPTNYWSCVASSADGSKLVAAVGDGAVGPIYTSSDSGATWTSNSAPKEAWMGVASSADGNKLVAVSLMGGVIATSTNGGADWIQTGFPLEQWHGVASSADGTKLAAAGSGGIYLSTDSGMTWVQATNVPAVANGWVCVASSADGTKLVASPAELSGRIYTSSDSGTTWVSNSVPLPGIPWTSLASSADGSQLVAVEVSSAAGCGIYISQTTPLPRLSIITSNNTVSLSWLIPSENFTLQQSPDLNSWTDVTNPAALNLTDLQNQVILPLSAGNCFYRLAIP